MRTQSLKVLPLKPGVGQYIAMHATLTARDFFLANHITLLCPTFILKKCDVIVQRDDNAGLKQDYESNMEYLCLFYFIQLLQETVADLVFVLSLLMTHSHTTRDIKRENTQHMRPWPALTLAPSLHCV